MINIKVKLLNIIITLIVVSQHVTPKQIGEANKFDDRKLLSIEDTRLQEEKDIVQKVINEMNFNLLDHKMKNYRDPNMNADNIMNNMTMFLKVRFRQPDDRSTRIAMGAVVTEKIIRKVAEDMYKFKIGKRQSIRGKREIGIEELISPSSFNEIYQAVECENLLPRPKCNRRSLFVRTADATCNNLIFQTHGSAFDKFGRLLPAQYEDGISTLRGSDRETSLPSPREISFIIHQNKGIFKFANINEPSVSHMTMQWGQFLDHDVNYIIEPGAGGEMVDLECIDKDEINEDEFCLNIPLLPNDPLKTILRQENPPRKTLPFERSAASCYEPLISNGPQTREIINRITSFVDASMVYGSTNEEQARLRLFKKGRLLEALDQNFNDFNPTFFNSERLKVQTGTLPLSDTPTGIPCKGGVPCFIAGDERVSEQFGLSVLHTIFLREHNRIAEELGRINPLWEDEAIYQVTKRILGAIVQKITYSEYLPIILGSDMYKKLIGTFRGYNASANARVFNEFATAAFRYGHTQIRSGFPRFNVRGRKLRELRLVEAFFNSKEFFLPNDGTSGGNEGTDPLLRGLLSINSRKLDEFINVVLTNRLFEKQAPAPLDLVSRNIQRGRDHGLPTYQQVRDYCETTFGIRGTISSGDTLKRLKQLYGTELEGLDLFVGGLSEERENRGVEIGLLGGTFACLVGLQYRLLRDGDRFWYEEGEGTTNTVFSDDQLKEIRKITLSRLICDNSNIAKIQRNAFRVGFREVSCNSIPQMNLNVFKDDKIGNMIEEEDFSSESFPGLRDTVRLNNEARAFYVQNQLDLTPVNQIDKITGMQGNEEDSENNFETEDQCWFKVELKTTSGANLINVVNTISKLGKEIKRDRQSTMFKSRAHLESAATCNEILCSTSRQRASIEVSLQNSLICSPLSFGDGLIPTRRTSRKSFNADIPFPFDARMGVFASLKECRAGGETISVENTWRSSYDWRSLFMEPASMPGVIYKCV